MSDVNYQLGITIVKVVCFGLGFSFSVAMAAQGEPEVIVSPEQTAIDDVKQGTFDRKAIADLDAQHQRLIEAQQTEEAFSLRLAELYSEYGALLIKAKRYDEATDVYSQALHIRKVNFGIYSAEQISLINVLFDIALLSDDGEKLIDYMRRATLIEQKGFSDPHVNVVLSEMALQTGHYFIDQFYTTIGRYSLRKKVLQQAKYYFDYVLYLQQGKTLKEQYSPYGELLLISHLEYSLIDDMPVTFNVTDLRLTRYLDDDNPSFRALELEREYNYLRASYGRSIAYLKRYLLKAKMEGNDQEILNALLAWGDNLILYGRDEEAKKYYRLAWNHAQKTSLSQAFQEKIKTPALIPDYIYYRQPDVNTAVTERVSIPLSFSVGGDGVVSNTKLMEDAEDAKPYFTRARRQLRGLYFRPAIVNGEPVAVNDVVYPVSLVAK